jgi:hypothetical protein
MAPELHWEFPLVLCTTSMLLDNRGTYRSLISGKSWCHKIGESAVRTTLPVRTAYDPSVRRPMAWSFSI